MGVVDAGNCVVGIVTDVSDKYAVVMSLFNKDSKISAELKKEQRCWNNNLGWKRTQPSAINRHTQKC